MHSTGPSQGILTAFSTLELIVVISILLGLAAISYPIYSSFKASANIRNTTMLVHSVATAIALYQGDAAWPWTRTSDSRRLLGRLWDLNADGLLDGDPARDSGFSDSLAVPNSVPTRTEALSSGYTGFLRMTAMSVTAGNAQNGQVVDAWRHPLQIAYANRIYGASSYGVWSNGPDGIANTSDDIQSWDLKQ